MTLDNLVAIGRLAYLQPDAISIERLMRAATRNLSDARVAGISPDTTFDVAYKSIMQCAMAALAACGFRTSQNQPGHHQTAIQSLGKTMGIETETIILLDALRKMRNLSDYSGDPITEPTAAACVEAAQALLEKTQRWLEHKK